MNYLPRENEWVIGLIRKDKIGKNDVWTEMCYCFTAISDVWFVKDRHDYIDVRCETVVDWVPKPDEKRRKSND